MNDDVEKQIEAVEGAPSETIVVVPRKPARDVQKLRAYRATYRAKKAAQQAAKLAESAKPKRKPKAKKASETTKSNRGPKGWPPEDRVRHGSKKWGLSVRRARCALGYTQAKFAELFGILQPHMCNIEKGTYRPSAELKARIDEKCAKIAARGKK